MWIHIDSPPEGEVDLAIRERWIGCIFWISPLDSEIPPEFCTGLITGQPTNRGGFPIFSYRAFEILGERDPEAAAWWRQHFPQHAVPGCRFLFDRSCCRRLASPFTEQELSATPDTCMGIGMRQFIEALRTDHDREVTIHHAFMSTEEHVLETVMDLPMTRGLLLRIAECFLEILQGSGNVATMLDDESAYRKIRRVGRGLMQDMLRLAQIHNLNVEPWEIAQPIFVSDLLVEIGVREGWVTPDEVVTARS